jgi:hypothetical protein
VTNSTSTFNLSPDAIIYLNDIGVPGSVVTAMIQHDQVLKGVSASQVAGAAPPPGVNPEQYAPLPQMPPPGATPVYPPTPQEMAADTSPPVDYGPTGMQPVDDSSYSSFYDALAPYGNWVDVAGYGPCWQPTVVVVNPYWHPYYNCGHWAYTDCGWYWLSGYSWGWAPFHYGRWFRHNQLGWCWAPDTTWGPSWVSWRYGATHCAWAPLPPSAWYRPGVGLTYQGRHVDSTFGFGLSASSFAVVPFKNFYDHHLPHYGLPARQAKDVLRTTVASTSIGGSNNRVINYGLPTSRVTAATGMRIQRLAVHEASFAGQGVRAEKLESAGTSVAVFRPNFEPQSGTQPASARWVNLKPVRNDAVVGGNSAAPALSGRSALPANVSRTSAMEIRGGRTDRFDSSTANPAVSQPASTSRSGTQSAPAGGMNRNGGASPSSAPSAAPRAPRQSYVWPPVNDKESTPPGALVVRGNPQATSDQTRTTAATHNSFPNFSVRERQQNDSIVAPPAQASASSAWSARQSALAERQVVAPAYRAPDAARSAAPAAPAYTPQHTYAAPAPSYTPRTEAVQTHPTYSAPPAPAPSAPAAQSQSSSGKSWR